MNKKVFALLYLVISSILNVLFTGVVIGVICAVVLLFMRFVFHPSQDAYATAIFGCFTVGLVLSFFLFSKITTKVVKKYRFDERFGGEKKSMQKENSDERKTVLPESALERDEDEKWKE